MTGRLLFRFLALWMALSGCVPAVTVRPEVAVPLPAPREATGRPRVLPDSLPPVAIVMDDMGSSLEEARVLGTLSLDLTFAVLPGRPRAPEVARALRGMGREVLLHLPMEPERQEAMEEEEFLRVSMSPEEMRRILARALERVPGARGVNNHMGSSFTKNPEALAPIAEALAEAGLPFLDSRTTPESAAQAVMTSRGLPSLRRHVFLDHEPGQVRARERLSELAMAARTLGCAIAIAHPLPDTIAVLEELAALEAPPVRVVPLSRLAGMPCAGLPWPPQVDLPSNPSGTMTRQR